MYTNDSKINKSYFKLGFGTSQIGGASTFANKQVGMGKQRLSDSISSIKYAKKSGINFFDTADIYGKGKAEKLLGEMIGQDENIVICSKYGNRFRNNNYFFDTSTKYLINSFKSTCKRLKRNYIDIFLLHSPPEKISLSREYLNTLEKLIVKKKIRSFGISARSVDFAINYIKEFDFIDYLEVIYNIADRRAEDRLFELCEKKNIKVIARIPFASGYLLKINLQKIFNTNDFRSKTDKGFINWLKKFHEKYENLSFDEDIFDYALRFCVSNNNIAVVIPGMRNVLQVKYNLVNFNKGALNKSILNKISNLPKYYYGWN